MTKPVKLNGPACPGFDPKESDLVVTGHANASFENPRAGVHVSLDTQVLESAAARAARTSRARCSRRCPGCLAYQLKQGPNIVGVTVEPLDFPKIGSVTRRLPRHDHGAIEGDGRLR